MLVTLPWFSVLCVRAVWAACCPSPSAAVSVRVCVCVCVCARVLTIHEGQISLFAVFFWKEVCGLSEGECAPSLQSEDLILRGLVLNPLNTSGLFNSLLFAMTP